MYVTYDVDDIIGRADRFGFQNFCSPGGYLYCFYMVGGYIIPILFYWCLADTFFICNKFKLFIKACHLLALILVQSFASNIEENFWTSTISWLIVECASLQEDSFH